MRSWGFGPASPADFAEHLAAPCAARDGAAAFPNLGRDAMLVAPCDLGAAEDRVPARRPRGPTTLNDKRHAAEDAAAAEARDAAARAAVPLDTRARGAYSIPRATGRPLRPTRYGHVANFVRGAPEAQVVALFKKVGETFEALVAQRGARPVWLSTEGSGVPWLHVRMDSRPKYYHTAAYKRYPREDL